MVRTESAFATGLYYLNETVSGTTAAIRPGRVSLLPEPLHERGDQGAYRRGALALCPAPAGERAREDRRRGAHQFRRAPLQLPVRQARAPSAHGRADPPALRRGRVHAPV